jgi:hypothetical protein
VLLSVEGSEVCWRWHLLWNMTPEWIGAVLHSSIMSFYKRIFFIFKFCVIILSYPSNFTKLSRESSN